MALHELPEASGVEIAKTLVKHFGWIIRKSGNHIVLTHTAHRMVTLSIPNHKRVKRPLLHAQLKRFGCSDEAFAEAFKS
jgi:predicted RNA binding protein YcfA (HicA-like mRNA interferase family)